MSALYNDGTVQYGSRALVIRQSNGSTLRGAAGGYVCDNITVNRPSKAVDHTNELGEPTGSVGIADFVTGTLTAQLADDTTPEIQTGDRIYCDASVGNNTPLDGAINEKFFVTSVGRALTKDGEVKLNVSFKKQYGA